MNPNKSQRRYFAKRANAVGVMNVKDFSETYPSNKKFLVVKFQPNHDKTIDYIPKKTFNDFDEAKKYAKEFADKKGSNNLHDKPSCANIPCTHEDVNEFRHDTKDWHLHGWA